MKLQEPERSKENLAVDQEKYAVYGVKMIARESSV